MTTQPTALPTFTEVCDELDKLQDRKGQDYSKADDPLANIRSAEAYGIPAWQGSVMRAGDKLARIQAFCRRGSLVNESLEDSLLDAAVYLIHAIRLYREARSVADPPEEPTPPQTPAVNAAAIGHRLTEHYYGAISKADTTIEVDALLARTNDPAIATVLGIKGVSQIMAHGARRKNEIKRVDAPAA